MPDVVFDDAAPEEVDALGQDVTELYNQAAEAEENMARMSLLVVWSHQGKSFK